MADEFRVIGNTAKAVDWREIDEPIRKVRKKRRKVKAKPVFVYVNERAHRLSLMAVFTLLIIAAGSLRVAASFASLRQARQIVANLQKDIRAQKQLVADLQSESVRRIDLEKIREIAENELGMREPTPDQMIPIRVPAESFAVAELIGQEPRETTGFWAWIRKLLSGAQ